MREPEVDQDLGADAVVAQVGREAELEVGLDGVAGPLLQLVGAQLVEQADAAALLGDVEEHAAPLLGDHRIAASSCSPQSQRCEPKTSPVRHSEWTRTSTFSLAVDLALDQRQVVLAVEDASGSRPR